MRDACQKTKRACIPFLLELVLLLYSSVSYAGDIPGIPIIQPPALHKNVQFQLGNDFFSLINNSDDFRTQQMTLSGFITDDLLIVIDQSLLTFRGANAELPDPPGTEGRLDQLSASLAYRLDTVNSDTDQLLLGIGLRSYGNFSGARIQNGVHRIIDNTLVNLPYVATRRTDAAIWLRASRQQYFTGLDNKPHWQFGYWLDATGLLTSDGQFDATLGGFGLVKYRDFDLWYGLRGDWREGYDRDLVQVAVAEQESGPAVVLGLAYGPIRLETVEGVGDNQNSFGRLVLSASNDPVHAFDLSRPYVAYQFGLVSPAVAVQNQLRWSPWHQQNNRRYAFVLDHRSGTDSRDDEATVFNINQQLTVGLETVFAAQARSDWLQPYIMLGAGYRSEYLEGQATLAGQQSEKVNSAVIVADVGARLYLAGSGDSWQLQLQLALTGWLPVKSKSVIFNGSNSELLRSDISWLSGINVVWSL